MPHPRPRRVAATVSAASAVVMLLVTGCSAPSEPDDGLRSELDALRDQVADLADNVNAADDLRIQALEDLDAIRTEILSVVEAATADLRGCADEVAAGAPGDACARAEATLDELASLVAP